MGLFLRKKQICSPSFTNFGQKIWQKQQECNGLYMVCYGLWLPILIKWCVYLVLTVEIWQKQQGSSGWQIGGRGKDQQGWESVQVFVVIFFNVLKEEVGLQFSIFFLEVERLDWIYAFFLCNGRVKIDLHSACARYLRIGLPHIVMVKYSQISFSWFSDAHKYIIQYNIFAHWTSTYCDAEVFSDFLFLVLWCSDAHKYIIQYNIFAYWTSTFCDAEVFSDFLFLGLWCSDAHKYDFATPQWDSELSNSGHKYVSLSKI